MRTLTALVVVFIASVASAQTRSVFIEELTWPEIKDAQAAGKTSAVIVAGGIEQNGHHMALAKHNVIARYVGGQIAERLGNALVYPVIPAAAVTLAIGGHLDAVPRFWSTVLLAEFVSYGMLPWLQTRPPRAIESAAGARHPPSAVRQFNEAILNRGSIQVNTVPSGHAAGAVAAALAVADVMPVAGIVFAFLAAAIVAATVLGRYHYLVDSLLGALVAVSAWLICR